MQRKVPGRHRADPRSVRDVARSTWRDIVPVVASAVRRMVALLLLLAAGAGFGALGALIAPGFGQPREAGFWGGFIVAVCLYVVTLVVVLVGSALGHVRLGAARERLEWFS